MRLEIVASNAWWLSTLKTYLEQELIVEDRLLPENRSIPPTQPDHQGPSTRPMFRYRGKMLPLFHGKKYFQDDGATPNPHLFGLVPRPWAMAPPWAFPIAVARYADTIPLWRPDDLLDWVPRVVVERSARATAVELRAIEQRRQRERMERCQPATLAYHESDASRTKRLLRALTATGQLGRIASDLFRAQKSSARARSIEAVSTGDPRIPSWPTGARARCWPLFAKRWSRMPRVWSGAGARTLPGIFARWVLYVELPTGQVSFHSPDRLDGPVYPGAWDGMRDASAGRILRLCDQILKNRPIDPPGASRKKGPKARSRRAMSAGSRDGLATRSTPSRVGKP